MIYVRLHSVIPLEIMPLANRHEGVELNELAVTLVTLDSKLKELEKHFGVICSKKRINISTIKTNLTSYTGLSFRYIVQGSTLEHCLLFEKALLVQYGVKYR